MVKIDWSLIVSLLLFGFVVATFFIIDFPSKDDSKNMQKEINNFSKTFSNEIKNLSEEINELKTQNLASSSELINATRSLAPQKNTLKLNFFYESNISTDDLNMMCGWSFVECFKSEEIEKSGGIGNGTYSYSRIEIINNNKVTQKDVKLSLNCDMNSIFLEGVTYPPARIKDFSTTIGFKWDIKFEEVYPDNKIIINFPYVLYKDSGTCNVEYYSGSSDVYTEIYTIYKNRIERVYPY